MLVFDVESKKCFQIKLNIKPGYVESSLMLSSIFCKDFFKSSSDLKHFDETAPSGPLVTRCSLRC